MPYAPGITYDHRALSDGIDDGIAGIAQAILSNSKRRREKEETAKAIETLQPMIEKMAPDAGVKLDKDIPKEMIPQVIALAGHLEQQKREAPLTELRMENERLRQRISQSEIDQAATNAAALRGAGAFLSPDNVNLPDPNEVTAAFQSGRPVPQSTRGANPERALATYAGGGGSDPRMLAELGGMVQDQARNQPRVPGGLQTFGRDASGRPVQGLVDAQGNVRYIDPPKTEEPTAKPFKIGDRKMYQVGSTILDEDGKPVKAETPKTLDPFAANALYARYQAVLQEATSDEKPGMFENKEKASGQRAAKRDQANFLAKQLGFAEPFPAAASSSAEQPAKASGPANEPQSPAELKAALASGALTLDQAKAFATRKGWK